MNEVAIIGAGPIGIELAAALNHAGIEALHLEAGQIGQTMSWYPRQAQFFSSNERISICGVPLQTPTQNKATREEYLAYLRSVVLQFGLQVRTFQRVLSIERLDEGFRLHTLHAGGHHTHRARHVVLSVGNMHKPRRIHVEGEDLPHVDHYFLEPHTYFRQKLLVVGGGNSAVEAALRCHRAGARVTLSYRSQSFEGKGIKSWLRPELEYRIHAGEIESMPGTQVLRITQTHATLRRHSGEELDVEADFVLLMTGYEMDGSLLDQMGVKRNHPKGAPLLNAMTMETSVPGLYVAGTAAGGSQSHPRLFIENAHGHVAAITRAIAGQDPVPVNPLAFETSLTEAALEV